MSYLLAPHLSDIFYSHGYEIRKTIFPFAVLTDKIKEMAVEFGRIRSPEFKAQGSGIFHLESEKNNI